ncbi:MAG: dihydropteroate synthase [Candidatus Lambdaproteobacteria bacterium]|nr:dihydropteroate synthase [Candidatus Lambdaproteobacteria bacterium]
MLDLRAIQSLLARHGTRLGAPVRPLEIGGRRFDFNVRRALMGVINLSTDSWYTESVCATPEQAIARGHLLAAQGADFVDIGAESSLPQAARVDAQTQRERLLPVVRALSAAGVPVSVESYHPEVLEAAAQAGARIFNLTGSRHEAETLAIARRFDAAVVLCYVQGETVRQVERFTFHDDMASELEAHFRQRLGRADAAGVSRCIVDPGLGFYYENLQDSALRINHQLQTLLNTFRLHALGYPTLNILPHAPEIFGAAARRAAEPMFAVLALLGGTHIVRTHELEVVAKVRDTLAVYQG